ncbi:acyltransferase [Acuticoccus sp. M5D2P5]|uniref:acyltransferase family protein n=1 Tax=Acuticoccus kalidii TaxID=2910977 RepID=UPI001F2BA961|nr:acyltransferase [Acuticoccus kalidii]MCF3935177.1 acyltransferase [Acuticoccus kalidii]
MQTKHHYAVLDGMRGVAAFVVLVFHVEQQNDLSAFPSARLAVDFFYILSGFIIAYSYEHRLTGDMSVRRFLVVRTVRLYPLLFLGVSLGIGLAAVSAVLQGFPAMDDIAVAGVLGLLALPSYVFPQWPTAYPFNAAEWSLFFEFFVNILYAFIARFLSAIVLTITLVLSFAALLANAIFQQGIDGGYDQDNWAFGFSRSIFPFFLGVLLYRLRPGVRQSTGWSCLLLAGLAVLLLTRLPGGGMMDVVYVAVLMPALVWFGGAVYAIAPVTKVLLIFGKLSYPVYILQAPMLRMGLEVKHRALLAPEWTFYLDLAQIAAVVAFSYFALVYFDEPVRARLSAMLRRRSAQRALAEPAGTA